MHQPTNGGSSEPEREVHKHQALLNTSAMETRKEQRGEQRDKRKAEETQEREETGKARTVLL